MRIWLLTLPVLAALGPVALAAAGSAEKGWRMDEFMISVWGGPNSPELGRCLAEDAGFNTVMGGVGMTGEHGVGILDLAHRYGLRVLLKIEPQAVTEAVREHPALWGYYVFDEPVQCKVTYESLLPAVQAFRQADPRHPVYINLNSADDAEAFIKTLDPDLLSLDRYQWWYGSEDYFPLLERYRALSLKHDLPLIWWVEANADENRYHYPSDNQAKLRQSVFTALAYGVKGIQWFGWGEACSWEASPDPARWQLKPAGEDVAAINCELQRLGPILLPLRSTGVYHTAPLPTDTHALPPDCPVQTEEPGLVLGLLQGAEAEYVLVANRDHALKKAAVLRLDPRVVSVERFNKRRGEWVPLPAADRRVTVRLQPGDGELLRLGR